MYYSIYKDLRNSSWQCLIDAKVSSLPVDVVAIARTAKIRIIKDSILNELSPCEAAKTYHDGDDWFIIYNDRNPVEVSRFAIAHELGHIFLGHSTTFGKYSGILEFGKKPKAEQQADAFALRLLAPACVLWGLKLSSPEDISRYCRIPIDISKTRSKRMKKLYSTGAFLSDHTEKLVFDNFKPYISKTISSKKDQERA